MTSKARGLANLGNAFDDGALGSRNKIINGAMVIDQRNAGASVAFPVGTGEAFPVDRWRCQNTGGTSAYSAQRVAEAPAGFLNSLKITTTTAAAVTAADSKHMWIPLEGFDVADLGFGTSDAKTVTLSFWVRSSVTGNHGAALSNAGAVRAYAFLYNIAQANTWEYKNVTIPGDTTGTWAKDNSAGMRVNFNIGSGSDYIVTPGAWGAGADRGAIGQVSILATAAATWQITGVQLEAGDTATPFEHRSFGQELALCQRYFEKSFSQEVAPANGVLQGDRTVGAAYTTTAIGLQINYNTEKRASPTLAFFRSSGTGATDNVWAYYNGSAWTSASSQSVNQTGTGTTSFSTNMTVSGRTFGQALIIGGFWTASAEL